MPKTPSRKRLTSAPAGCSGPVAGFSVEVPGVGPFAILQSLAPHTMGQRLCRLSGLAVQGKRPPLTGTGRPRTRSYRSMGSAPTR